MHAIISVMIALACFPVSDATAESALQSVTLYVGPTTRQFASEIVQGHFNIDGTMLGLAYDRQLTDLGAGFRLEAEAQATHFFMKPSYSTLAAGLGVRYDTSRWIGQASSFAFYTGPSYADAATRNNDESEHFLEYVSLEFSLENISNSQFDGVVRMFHRSGAFGLYQNNTDVGTMFGIGIRRRF